MIFTGTDFKWQFSFRSNGPRRNYNTIVVTSRFTVRFFFLFWRSSTNDEKREYPAEYLVNGSRKIRNVLTIMGGCCRVKSKSDGENKSDETACNIQNGARLLNGPEIARTNAMLSEKGKNDRTFCIIIIGGFSRSCEHKTNIYKTPTAVRLFYIMSLRRARPHIRCTDKYEPVNKYCKSRKIFFFTSASARAQPSLFIARSLVLSPFRFSCTRSANRYSQRSRVSVAYTSIIKIRFKTAGN